MANLFIKQAKLYSDVRPNYPEELLRFISSKTPCHDLVWDVGTGSGQAAISLARIYKNVVGTDTSRNLIELAPELPNARFRWTPPKMTLPELEQHVAKESTVDLITIATAMHYFDLPTFYQQVRHVLKKPNGVIAAWTYRIPSFDNKKFDSVLEKFFTVDTKPYWAPQKPLVDDKYKTIDFPFEAVEGCDHTGPFEFKAERLMDLEGLFQLIRTWSAYPVAKDKGVELLSEEVVEEFKNAWGEDVQSQKTATFTFYLRIGKVGNPIM